MVDAMFSRSEPILLSPVTIIVCYHYWIVCQLSVYSCAFASEDLFIASGINDLILCFIFNAPRKLYLLCGQPGQFIFPSTLSF